MKWLKEDLEDHQGRLLPRASALSGVGERTRRLRSPGQTQAGFMRPTFHWQTCTSISRCPPPNSVSRRLPLLGDKVCVCCFFSSIWLVTKQQQQQQQKKTLKVECLGSKQPSPDDNKDKQKKWGLTKKKKRKKKDSSENLLRENNNWHRGSTCVKQSNVNEK